MPYTTPSLTAATTALSQRLSDPGQVRWTLAELQRYVREAIRTWSAYTQPYRDHGVFPSVAGQAFYDLPTLLPAFRSYTVTDQDLVTDLEYHLLEPPTPAAWTGSAQFTLADLTQALERRRNQFLMETGCRVTRSVLMTLPPPQGRMVLPEAILAIRRAAWVATTGSITPILRSDEWALTHFDANWVQDPTRPPKVYSTSATPPLTIQFGPPTLDAGQLDLIAVEKGATLDPTTGVLLGIPDDWTWVVKFGALADLLGRSGLATDLARASYAESRWKEGISRAIDASVVLAARINNVTCRVGSLSDTDTYNPTWQTTTGIPRGVLQTGQNLIAVYPRANGVFGLTLDIVRNAPVPTAPGDPIQIGADGYDILLDYAQHLALLKEGTAELTAAQPLLERFLRFCGVTQAKQQAEQPNRAPLLGQTGQDHRALPAQLPPVEASA